LKAFIKKVVIFCLPIILLATAFELLLRKIPNDFAYKKNYLDKNSNKIKVLFLGNSHMYFGVNPQLLNFNSFNGSHVSQSLNFDNSIIEKYEGKWDSLKTIVLTIDYLSLYTSLDKGIEKWRVKNYNVYYRIYESLALSNNFEILNTDAKSNIERIRDFYFDKKSSLTCNAFGWGTNYKSSDKRDLNETGLLAAKRHTVVNKNDGILKANLQALHSIIGLSKKHNVQLVFVTLPAYKTYVENLDSLQLNNTIDTIKVIANANTNCKYLNFLTDTSFTSNDFYDADHLNENGAQKFTYKMFEILK
jgi:hypothetical protein